MTDIFDQARTYIKSISTRTWLKMSVTSYEAMRQLYNESETRILESLVQAAPESEQTRVWTELAIKMIHCIILFKEHAERTHRAAVNTAEYMTYIRSIQQGKVVNPHHDCAWAKRGPQVVKQYHSLTRQKQHMERMCRKINAILQGFQTRRDRSRPNKLWDNLFVMPPEITFSESYWRRGGQGPWTPPFHATLQSLIQNVDIPGVFYIRPKTLLTEMAEEMENESTEITIGHMVNEIDQLIDVEKVN